MSVPLPAEVGDTSSIGFVGYFWAFAVPHTPAASAPLIRTASTLRDFVISVSSVQVSIDPWKVSPPPATAVNYGTPSSPPSVLRDCENVRPVPARLSIAGGTDKAHPIGQAFQGERDE